MSDALHFTMVVLIIAGLTFVFKGDPSLFDLWHAQAVSAAKCR